MNKSKKSHLAKAFQDMIIEILITKAKLAFKKLKSKYNIKDVAIVGGVAANKSIRKSFKKICKKNKYKLIFPPIDLCGDNAAMIALACIEKLNKNMNPDLHFNADPRLALKK